MSIGITLALLAAVGYGTADFVGGAGARRAPPCPSSSSASSTGAAAMLVVGLASPGTPTLAHLAWALLAGLGSAAGSIFLLRGLSRGRMAVVAPTSASAPPCCRSWPDSPVANDRSPWSGSASSSRCRGSGWSRARSRTARQSSGRRGRGAFVDGLLAGLGFGVLFVALGQIPESAGTLPLALNQLTGALVTVVVATVLRQPWQPSTRRRRLGSHVGPARRVRQPRVRRGQPPRRPRRGRRARLALPRRHRAPGPRPCSASASAPGSASAWSSARRPSA